MPFSGVLGGAKESSRQEPEVGNSDQDFQTLSPGANPTTSSYNASVVKIYNATGSLERFENKNIFFCFERCSILQRWRCSKFKSRT
jgi:hypothetical protein